MLRQIAFGSTISLADISVHAMAMVVCGHPRGTKRCIEMPVSSYFAPKYHHDRDGRGANGSACVRDSGLVARLRARSGDARRRRPVVFRFRQFYDARICDIVPTPRWRLLGPMTAMNGVLLFGWSVAVMFEVLSLALERK